MEWKLSSLVSSPTAMSQAESGSESRSVKLPAPRQVRETSTETIIRCQWSLLAQNVAATLIGSV